MSSLSSSFLPLYVVKEGGLSNSVPPDEEVTVRAIGIAMETVKITTK